MITPNDARYLKALKIQADPDIIAPPKPAAPFKFWPQPGIVVPPEPTTKKPWTDCTPNDATFLRSLRITPSIMTEAGHGEN